MTTNKIVKTWREVRDLLNAADDAALDQPIMLLGEDVHHQGTIAQQAEDLYDDGEYIMPASEMSSDFVPDGPPLYAKGSFLVNTDREYVTE